MSYPIRMFDGHEYWFLTARTFQSRALMTPRSPLIRDVCGGVLARALSRYPIELFGYAFLSNHLHLIVRANGTVVADFMRYLLGNLAKKLAPLVRRRGWRDRFWQKRYSAAPILDDGAFDACFRYVLAHGVKEGLVRSVLDWPGLHCAAQLLDGEPRIFNWYNWSKRWCGRSRAVVARDEVGARYGDELAEPETLELSTPPHWQFDSSESRRVFVTALIEDIERQHRKPHVLGVKAIQEQTIAAPAWSKRTPQPRCNTTLAVVRAQYLVRYAEFVSAHRAASARWKAGDVSAVFPPGSFKPVMRTRLLEATASTSR